MKISVLDHQYKTRYLCQQLHQAGHEIQFNQIDHPDVILADYPTGWGGQKHQLVVWAHQQGIPVFSPPHGGLPLTEYDGLTPPCPELTAELVHGPGFREVYESFGYPVPVEVIGFTYSPVRPFRPVRQLERILFAPRHPATVDANTPFHGAQESNRRAYQQFLAYPAGWKRLRRYGTHQANGTWADPEVEDRPVKDLYMDEAMLQEIRWADLVIAEGTFACLALAQGKPVVMIDQAPAVKDWTGEPVHHPWLYQDLLKYPFSLDRDPLDELVPEALVGGPDVDDWKTRFIGEPLNVERLIEILEGALVA